MNKELSILKGRRKSIIFQSFFWKIIILCFIFITTDISLLSNLKWETFGYMHNRRFLCEVLPIDNHSLLVMGGYEQTDIALNSCEIVDLLDNSITYTAPMNFGRFRFYSVLTKDSDVVAIGGENNHVMNAAVELFSRKTRTWKLLGNMLTERSQHVAYFLDDSSLMIVGGMNSAFQTLNSAEIFNINTGTSKYVKPFPYPFNCSSTFLSSSNKQIVFSGRSDGGNSKRYNTLYTYDRINDDWILTGTMPDNLFLVKPLKLLNGKVLASGGSRSEIPLSFSNQILLESNNSLYPFSTMISDRVTHGMAQLNDSCVIIAGGYDMKDRNLSNADLINLKTGERTDAPAMQLKRRYFCMIALPYPKGNLIRSVLALGGGDDQWSTYSDTLGYKSVEILSEESEDISITKTKDECGVAEFEITDKDLIDEISLIESESHNVILNLKTILPSTKVIVQISLKNINQIGICKLKCYSKTSNRVEFFNDTIVNNYNYIKISIDTTDGVLHFGKVHCNETICKRINFVNTSNNYLNISYMSLKKNVNFSISPITKQMKLNPNDSIAIEICFSPSNSLFYTDSLAIGYLCNNFLIPIDGDNEPNAYYAESNCNMKLKMNENIKEEISLFPNPAHGAINISLENLSLSDIKALLLYDIYGRSITLNKEKFSYSNDKGISVDISSLTPGVYLINVILGSGIKVLRASVY